MLPPEIQGPVSFLGAPRRVDHLPVVGDVLRRLAVAEAVDELVPEHPACEISPGQCVEVLIVAILSGSHPLYCVGGTPTGWDLDLTLGEDYDPEGLSDTRLGPALDCVFEASVGKINAAVRLRAVEAFERTSAADTSTLGLWPPRVLWGR